VAVFQPHRYSRLSVLMNSFATSFNQADVLIITEIYPAGETPIAGVSGKVLHEEIVQFGHKNVYFEPDMKKIASLVGKMAQPEDMILIMGAGNIYEVIPDIIKTLESKG
ncbi:MAG: UDP-N-acetylmuramate--L-alanine ligase, partial [Candidatus Aminicenantes bacterium]|nr:UDP-N-acetylmuramate--L-alanine ligase [Candidatus Aminicenantes bacterium]